MSRRFFWEIVIWFLAGKRTTIIYLYVWIYKNRVISNTIILLLFQEHTEPTHPPWVFKRSNAACLPAGDSRYAGERVLICSNSKVFVDPDISVHVYNQTKSTGVWPK